MELSDRHSLPAVPGFSLDLAKKSRKRVRKKEVAEGGASREHERAEREQEGAQREHMDQTGVSGGSKAATVRFDDRHVLASDRDEYTYIYIHYIHSDHGICDGLF